MVQNLEVKEGQDAEAVRRQFDRSLFVEHWETPGAVVRPQKEREPGAPLWWEDDEEASSAFLAAQGVVL